MTGVTSLVRLVLAAVIVGGVWLFAEPAIMRFKHRHQLERAVARLRKEIRYYEKDGVFQ